MPKQNINRRQFLVITGGMLGAAALTCTGLAAASTQPEVQFINTTFGEDISMNNKILVAYASRSGTTATIAEAIGKTIAENGVLVDVRPMKEIKDISAYQAVVAGSAIRDRKWLPEGMQFIQENQLALSRKPFASFMVCITLAMKGAADYRQALMEWMAPVRALVKPVSEGYFAGMLDFSKLPFFPEGLTMRIPVALGIFPADDRRDWKAIRSWAQTTGPLLIS